MDVLALLSLVLSFLASSRLGQMIRRTAVPESGNGLDVVAYFIRVSAESWIERRSGKACKRLETLKQVTALLR